METRYFQQHRKYGYPKFNLAVVIEAFGRFFKLMFFSYVFTIFVQSYYESLIFGTNCSQIFLKYNFGKYVIFHFLNF